ncbi:hypothetical protein Tco_0519232 [Tanacetum coccineum]
MSNGEEVPDLGESSGHRLEIRDRTTMFVVIAGFGHLVSGNISNAGGGAGLALCLSKSRRITHFTRGTGNYFDKLASPIEGHLSALGSIIKDRNRKNKSNPIQLDFDEEDNAVKDTRIVKGKEVVDDDLKKPFKEVLKHLSHARS